MAHANVVRRYARYRETLDLQVRMGVVQFPGRDGVTLERMRPSWELFDAQPESYRESVLPSACQTRLAVEAAIPMGWEKYVGGSGRVFGMSGYGASGPYKELVGEFGFTTDTVIAMVRDMRM